MKLGKKSKKFAKKSAKAQGSIKRKEMKKKKGGGFRSEIERLAEKDPEFYEYLKNDEADIFNFSDDDVDNDDNDDGDVEDVDDDDIDDEEDADMADVDDEEVDGDFSDGDDDTCGHENGEYEMNSVHSFSGSDDNVEDEEEEESEGSNEMKLSDKSTVKIRLDPSTKKKLVDLKLSSFLNQVLSNPLEHRRLLSEVVKQSIDCFVACVVDVSGNRSGAAKKSGKSKKTTKSNTTILRSQFVVNSEEVFDDIVQMCFANLGKCLMILMNPIEQKDNNKVKKLGKKHKARKESSTTYKHWHKYRIVTKQYLFAVLTFLDELQHNDEIITEGLKTISELVDLYLHFPKICKQLIKTVTRFWSRRNESVQSVAFIVLCKLVRLDNDSFPQVYKNCYVSYIANSKVVNSETLPLIKFMQRSFTELSFLVPKQSYQFAFVYIRQFSIHLRNAAQAKKKDFISSIYNWQFLNGLSLWVVVISQSVKTLQTFAWFKDLRHPIIEIIGILRKVFMSAKYLPLGILCVRILLQIQVSCKLYIPTLAMSVELLDFLAQVDKRKPAMGKNSQKIIEISEILRFSKIQLSDSGIRTALAEELFKLILECSMAIKNNLAFPEIISPLNQQIKNFIKNCRNPDHVSMFKSLDRKLKDHGAHVSKIISLNSFNLKEYNNEFEQMFNAHDKGSPLTQFYASFTRSLKVKLETRRTAEANTNEHAGKLKKEMKQKVNGATKVRKRKRLSSGSYKSASVKSKRAQ